MKYTRMAIAEVLTDELVADVIAKMQEHVRNLPYVAGHSILHEEGGRMVILITHWRSLPDCIQYHSGRANRQFTADTYHMLAGNYVIKLFHNKAEGSSV